MNLMKNKTNSQSGVFEIVKPNYIENQLDYIKVNDNYNQVIVAVGYPRYIQPGWLNRIVSAEGDFDFSMFIEPSSLQTVLTDLNRELIKQKSDIMAAETKGIASPSLRLQYNDTYRTLERLQSGKEKLFNFSFYINGRAKSKEELKLLNKNLESELNSMMIIPKVPYFYMQQGLQSIVPIKLDKLKIARNMPSNALSACFPFTSQFFTKEENGIMFGLNKYNNIPIILDVFNFTNYNGLCLGSSGVGKSFFVKVFILRNILQGVKTIVVDPQGEYSDLIKSHGGKIIEISKKSESMINPLDISGYEFMDKMLSLIDLFMIMLDGLSQSEKMILDSALRATYASKGITLNAMYDTKKQPLLGDLYEVLQKERKQAKKFEKSSYDSLLSRLKIYVEGTFKFFNKATNLDLADDMISFNIMEIPKQVRPAIMFMVLDYIHKKMQKDKERKMLVIDEAWTLLKHVEQASYIFELIKTARKFGLGIVIITQEVSDLLTTRAGKTILANTSWRMLFRQESAVIKELNEKFNLNEEEQNFILSAEKGEGLLVAMNERIPIKVVASEKEYKLITTNPEEVRRIKGEIG